MEYEKVVSGNNMIKNKNGNGVCFTRLDVLFRL